MLNHPDLPDRSPAASSDAPLADRLRERLARAGAQYDRRVGATKPRLQRRPPSLLLVPAESPADSSHRRERACLRTVFHELGDAHRTYRARTGSRVTPGLWAATTAFKQEPSLISLVPVAAYLDELGLLPW